MRKSNIKIIVGKDEPVEKAIRKFKKLCERAGIKKECKNRRYYEKPSETRRKKIRKRERNNNNKKNNNFDKKFKKQSQKNWIFTHPKLTSPDN